MSRCVSPLSAWRGATPTDRGRYPASFSLQSAFADAPLELPCGKCCGCVQDRAESWAIRCYHESTQHERNCFATLTYAPESVPERVVKADLQKFFKRLRKDEFKFRYFAVGEHGGQTGRPHYHVLFFGQDFRDGAIRAGMGAKSSNEYYVSPALSEVWGEGHVLCAPCEAAAIFYVCGYALKGLGDPDTFFLGSRRPPLGNTWLDQYHDDISRNNFVTIDGVRHSVPRSYLKRPERALDFDHLVSARARHAELLDPEVRWTRRCSQRSREVNIHASAAAARGAI